MSHISRSNAAATAPCQGFGIAVLFPDVEPEVLAREEAIEVRRIDTAASGAWQTYLRRVLPALERHSAADMADALMAAGLGSKEAWRHAADMRRRAISSGDVNRVRFWGEVMATLVPAR